MRILFINSVCGIKSTGRICTDLAAALEAEGHVVKIAYGRDAYVPEAFQKYAVRVGSDWTCKMHAIQTRLFDTHGFGSRQATKAFLEWADAYKPDLLWLHNLHGYYINVELLFDWIKRHPDMQVKWSIHDCWAFTGHCTHFSYENCFQWQKHCRRCVKLKSYPACYFFNSVSKNYQRKRTAFTGVKKMVLIAPSQWMADLLRQSFLGEYPIEIQRNTIDTTVFKPTFGNFRERNDLQNKIMVLGVASTWNDRKGLSDFYRLSEMLDARFRIVIVGLNNKQMKALPQGIVGIHRTDSVRELAEIYSAADVFFNPTKEDTYSMVNLEAEACGTPVITYNTGGAPEAIHRTDSRVVNDLSEAAALIKALAR